MSASPVVVLEMRASAGVGLLAARAPARVMPHLSGRPSAAVGGAPSVLRRLHWV